MASGHVNRTNRPNTWLHRPATRREDSPCQLGAVHTWHLADMTTVIADVCFRGQSRHSEMRRRCLPMTQTGHWCDLDHTTYTQDLGNIVLKP
jgi:hypothetical protein